MGPTTRCNEWLVQRPRLRSSRPKVVPPKHIPVRQLDGSHQCTYPCASPDSGIEGGPSTSSTHVHPMWQPPPPPTMPLGPACWEYRCGMPPQPDKGYASSDSNPYHYPGCGGESHAGGPAGHSCQVDYAPTLPVSSDGAGSSNATCYSLAPCQLKGGGCFSGHRAYGHGRCCDRGSISNKSSIFLVELGTRAPGTPRSAFGVVEPWTDPDDISQRSSTSTSIAEEAAEEAAVSEAAEAAISEAAELSEAAEEVAEAAVSEAAEEV